MLILLVLVGRILISAWASSSSGRRVSCFGHHQRKLGQLGLFSSILKIGFFCFGADLLLLLVDALQLHLCGAAVALDALVQALLVADCSSSRAICSRKMPRRWLMSCALACCACSAVCRAWVCSVSVWIWAAVSFCCCWRLMLGGGFVGGGQRLLPLHIIEQVLLLRELAGEGLIALGGFGLFFQLFHLAARIRSANRPGAANARACLSDGLRSLCGALYI